MTLLEPARTGRPVSLRPSQWRTTVRALLASWRAELSGAAEYRVDLVSGTLVSTIWLAVSITPMLVVAVHTDGAGGWTLPRLLLLQAIWYLLDAVTWALLIMNVGWWEEYVRLGTLDGMLLRPVNSLVMCSLSKLHPPDLPKVVLALGLGVVAIALGGGPVGVVPTLACILATLSALVLMWAIAVLANYKALTHVQFDGWAAVFAAQNASRVPIPLYGQALSIVFTAVVPIAFLATVPARLFYGDAAAWVALISVALAGAAILLTSMLWRRELRRYAGAMG